MPSIEPVFRCQGSDGNIYDVRRGVDRCDVSAAAEEPAEAFDSLWTLEGRPVQYVCKGHYHLDGSAIDLTTDDPNAP